MKELIPYAAATLACAAAACLLYAYASAQAGLVMALIALMALWAAVEKARSLSLHE
jgi:hypothetical protein